MRASHALRYVVAAAALGCVSLFALDSVIPEAEGQTNLLNDGQIGFVMQQFGNAGLAGEQVCPDGRSLGPRQIFEQSEEGQRREGETEEEFGARLQRGGMSLSMNDGVNYCQNPELAPPDNFYQTMNDTQVRAYGIDLDGQNSTANSTPVPGTCAQNDFRGGDGRRGVDNQYARLTGCTGQPTHHPEGYSDWVAPPPDGVGQENTMLEGGWGVLVWLRGVDSLENDDEVEVGIYANNDPIQLNPARDAAIPDMTYAPDQDPNYRAETRGRIVNGVLTTDPVNVRFHWLVAGMHLDRVLNHARIEARITSSGQLEGFLAGYSPVEALYDMQYAFRSARGDDGEPLGARGAMFATIATSAIGRTCQGPYQAAYRLADGDYDPETGRCTSLSTQYVMRGTRAFIADVATQGANDNLVE